MTVRGARNAARTTIRWIRILWPAVFLIPLGFWAGRYCSLSLTDPIYHALLAAHVHIAMIWAALAILSLGTATVRVFVLEQQVGTLLKFRSEPSQNVQAIFEEVKSWLETSAELIVLDLPNPIAFPLWRKNAIVVSEGMFRGLKASGARLVLLHELEHLRRNDQWRALLWHVLFALLILPGFGAVEQLLNRKRERAVDAICGSDSPDTYANLLLRGSTRRDKLYGSICTSNVGVPGLTGLNAEPEYLADRTLPAALSVLVLGLVVLSQLLFFSTLPFLETHHC